MGSPLTRSPLIRQPLRPSHYGCSPSPIYLRLYPPETTSVSSCGLGSLARTVVVAANCFTFYNTRGWGGESCESTPSMSTHSPQTLHCQKYLAFCCNCTCLVSCVTLHFIVKSLVRVRQWVTYVELDVGVVSVVLVDLPVAGGDGQEFPFSVVHELPLVIGDGLGAPPQSQVYFRHCTQR